MLAAGQVARLGAHLVLLVALGLGFALALVDHHAAERDPGHSHLVLAASGSERAHALAFHRHGFERPHAHEQAAGQPLPGRADPRSAAEPQVVAVHDPNGASAVELTGQVLLAPHWPTPWATLHPGAWLFPRPLSLSGLAISPLEPPPRG